MKMPDCHCAFCRLWMCSTDVYCSKQTGSSSTKGNHHPRFHALSGQKKTVDAAKIVAAQKMLLKQKLQQTFVNGLLGFITLGIYTASAALPTIIA